MGAAHPGGDGLGGGESVGDVIVDPWVVTGANADGFSACLPPHCPQEQHLALQQPGRAAIDACKVEVQRTYWRRHLAALAFLAHACDRSSNLSQRALQVLDQRDGGSRDEKAAAAPEAWAKNEELCHTLGVIPVSESERPCLRGFGFSTSRHDAQQRLQRRSNQPPPGQERQHHHP